MRTGVILVVRAARQAGRDGVVGVQEDRKQLLQVPVDVREVAEERLQSLRLALRGVLVPAVRMDTSLCLAVTDGREVPRLLPSRETPER